MEDLFWLKWMSVLRAILLRRCLIWLPHWGRVTHICVSRLSIIGSDNGLSPDRRRTIIWTNAGILLIETLGTNFNEILIEIHTFSFNNIHLKMLSGKWRPFCLGLNVLKEIVYSVYTPYFYIGLHLAQPQIKHGARFNSLRPRENGRHFADDVFKRIFLNENVLISIEISLKFVPKGQMNNIPALAHITAWRRPGDKPLSEPRKVSLPTHICVTRPQWVNTRMIAVVHCVYR